MTDNTGVLLNQNLQTISDTSDLIEFYKPQCLYLKPIARILVTVSLPQLRQPGQSISNWDLMERIKKLARPVEFESIRVVQNTVEFVKFEADLDNKNVLTKTIKSLNGASVKMIGFFESLKVKAAEAAPDCPTRHDWDTFFRNAKNMNENLPGERPDTIYLAHIPCKWFIDLRKANILDPNKPKDMPSDFVLRRAFEAFGDIRCVDIPATDKYRRHMSKSGMKFTSIAWQSESENFGDVTFESYIQFVEYVSFQQCMDTLRGMKLVHLEKDGRAVATNMKVDFDKSRHLSDKSIRKRRIEREKLIEIENLKKEEELARKAILEAQQASTVAQQSERRKQREEKRRLKNLERKRKQEEEEMEIRIRTEERKLVVAERKLESIRLLKEVLDRVHKRKAREQIAQVEAELEEAVKREAKLKLMRKKQQEQEENRIASKYKGRQVDYSTEVKKEVVDSDEEREARQRNAPLGDRWKNDKYYEMYGHERRGREDFYYGASRPNVDYRDGRYDDRFDRRDRNRRYDDYRASRPTRRSPTPPRKTLVSGRDLRRGIDPNENRNRRRSKERKKEKKREKLERRERRSKRAEKEKHEEERRKRLRDGSPLAVPLQYTNRSLPYDGRDVRYGGRAKRSPSPQDVKPNPVEFGKRPRIRAPSPPTATSRVKKTHGADYSSGASSDDEDMPLDTRVRINEKMREYRNRLEDEELKRIQAEEKEKEMQAEKIKRQQDRERARAAGENTDEYHSSAKEKLDDDKNAKKRKKKEKKKKKNKRRRKEHSDSVSFGENEDEAIEYVYEYADGRREVVSGTAKKFDQNRLLQQRLNEIEGTTTEAKDTEEIVLEYGDDDDDDVVIV